MSRYIRVTATQMQWLKIIPPSTHGLWLSLLWYGGGNGQVWASRATLAEMVGQSERTVSRGLRALESCRAIVTKERNGNTSLIQMQTLDTIVNPPLTEVSTPPLTDMSTPLDKTVNPPLTEVSSKEEKEEAKLKLLLLNNSSEELCFYEQILFSLFKKWSEPDSGLKTKFWRLHEDQTFSDWFHSLEIDFTVWTEKEFREQCIKMDTWMLKQAVKPDSKAWRYEYWQKGIVSWLSKCAPKKIAVVKEPEKKEIQLDEHDNKWISQFLLDIDCGLDKDTQPSDAIHRKMEQYPDTDYVKQKYINMLHIG
jgi:hypothetical protein